MAGEASTYFFNGTLMDRDVLCIVSGLSLAPMRLRPAVLPGYRRVRVQDVQYPAVYVSDGHSVEGCAVHGIPRPAAERLRLFENDGYELAVAPVLIGNNVNRKAALFAASARMNLTDEEWSFEDWRRHHRRQFMTRVKTWAEKLENS
jgi:hypothetical protein